MRSKLVLTLASVALLAGCGGGSDRLSKAEFEQRIQADGMTVQKAVAKINSDPASLGALAKQVAAAERAVQVAADDLDAAEPPEDAAAGVKTIVRGLRAIGVQLKKLQLAARNGDPLAAQSAVAAIQSSPAVRAAQRAATSLKKKGYDIGLIGS